MEPRRFLRAILNTTLGVLAVAGQIAMAAPTHGQPDADAADRDLERPPSWSIPSYPEVRRRMNGWLDAVALADQARKDEIAAVREAWPEQQPVDPAADVLDHVMDSFARLDTRCAALRQSMVDGRTAAESAAADIGAKNQ